jgi:hypothetical protein
MLSEKVKTFEAFQNQADAEADATSAILKPVVPSVVQTQDQAPAQAQTQTATPAVQPIQSATITEPTDKALIKKTLDQSELQQRLAAQNALSQVSL